MSTSLVPNEFATRVVSTAGAGAAAVVAKRVPRTVMVPSSLRKYIFRMIGNLLAKDDFLPGPSSERRRRISV